MKQHVRTFLVTTLIITLIVLMITHPSTLIDSVTKAVILWATRVFPILFPFYLVSILAMHYNLSSFIGKLLSPITRVLFKTPKVSGFVFVTSLMSGNPQSAVLLKELEQKKEITRTDAEHLLMFCVFINPLFVMGTIAYTYFNNASVGHIIWISHVLANVILGLVLRFKMYDQRQSLYHLETVDHILPQNKKNLTLGEVLTKAIHDGMNIMFLVCGYMIFFNMLSQFIIETNAIPSLMNLVGSKQDPELIEALILGVLELINFLDKITKVDINLRLMIAIITAYVSFAGLSIHMQIYGILDQMKIKYKRFLLFRVLQMFISGTLAYGLFPYLYNEQAKQTFNRISTESLNHGLLLSTLFILIISFIYLILLGKKSASELS